MRILITAGGTTERIDQVRSIINHSTGALGCQMAAVFLQQGTTVDYVTTKRALQPAPHDNLSVHFIETTSELATTLEHQLKTTPYDAVIHSMAVSDFTPQNHLNEANFLKGLNDYLAKHPGKVDATLFQHLEGTENDETKISSNTDHLVLVLEKTPKVIRMIKEIQPKTLLVSFKLLVDVEKEELFKVAYASLKKNNGDFVLANDLTSIHPSQHLGYLYDHLGNEIGQATTKEQIANLIAETIGERLNG